MISYKQFLANKRNALMAEAQGIEVARNKLNRKLFQFQKDIVSWALQRGRAAIFADCGLGKTPMQLDWARHVCKATDGNVLILAPLAVAEQTKREGDKFNIPVKVVRSQEQIVKGINITNYEMLDHFDAESFTGVVLDESSILKNYLGRVRTQIIDTFANTPYKLACTATPSPNDYTELGNHSQFLGIATMGEMLATFFINDAGKKGQANQWRLKRHAVEKYWKWVSSWAVMIKHPRDLGYDDEGFDLPKLNIKIETVEHDYTRKGELLPPASMTLNERRMVRRDSIEERLQKVVEISNSTKKPVLIWCNLNNESEAASRAINGAVEVQGKDNPDDKRNNLLGFASGDIRVLITKPRIAGFGMNWQHCNDVIFFGLSDSYEQYYQAIRRCWRYGNNKPVNVSIVVTDTEKIVVNNILRKEKEFEAMGKMMIKNTSKITRKNLKSSKREIAKYKTADKSSTNWELKMGDCVERTKEIKKGSVGYSIFSPPFSDLYTYSNSERDLGNSLNDTEFFKHFGYLIKELYRITMPGRLCSVHCMLLPRQKFKHGHIGLYDFRGDIIREFERNKWYFHSEVVIWKDPVTAMQRTKAIGLLHKQLKKDSVLSRQGIPDYVVTFRKPEENPEPVAHTDENYPVKLWQQIASPIWTDINQSDTLQKKSAREQADEKHICPLQLEVIRRCIRLWSNPNDIVFSPFAGIGSELYVALQEGRRGLGIELKESYYRQAVRNCTMVSRQTNNLFSNEELRK